MHAGIIAVVKAAIILGLKGRADVYQASLKKGNLWVNIQGEYDGLGFSCQKYKRCLEFQKAVFSMIYIPFRKDANDTVVV